MGLCGGHKLREIINLFCWLNCNWLHWRSIHTASLPTPFIRIKLVQLSSKNQLWNFMVCLSTQHLKDWLWWTHKTLSLGRELQKVGGPKCTAIVYLSSYFAVKWGVLPSLPSILSPIQWNPLLRTSKKSCLISTFDQVLKMDSLIVPQNKVSSIAIPCLYNNAN